MPTTVTLELLRCPNCGASVCRPFHQCHNCGTDFVQIIEKAPSSTNARSVADIDRHLLEPHRRSNYKGELDSLVVTEQREIDQCSKRFFACLATVVLLFILALASWEANAGKPRGMNSFFWPCFAFFGTIVLLRPFSENWSRRRRVLRARKSRVLASGQDYDPDLETHVARMIMQAEDANIVKKMIAVFNYLGERNEFCDDIIWISRTNRGQYEQWRLAQESDGRIVCEVKVGVSCHDVYRYIPGSWDAHLSALFLKAGREKDREQREEERKARERKQREADMRRAATAEKRNRFSFSN